MSSMEALPLITYCLLAALLCCSAFSAPSIPATPSLSSLVPQDGGCPPVPSEWMHPFTSPELQDAVKKVLTERHNASTLWGTYQPNRYFGIKSRTHPVSVGSGLLWHGAGSSVVGARMECRQEDKLDKYGWAQHDGRRYGRQVIEDTASKVGLVTEFVRLDGEKGDWAARVTLKETEAPKAADEAEGGGLGKEAPAVYWYLGLDCDGAEEGGDCLTLAGNEEGLKIEVDSSSDRAAVFIHGATPDLGAFTLEVNAYSSSSSPLAVSYMGLAQISLADVQEALGAEHKKRFLGGGEAALKKRGRADALPDTLSPRSTVVVLKVSGAGGLVLDAVLHRGDELTDEEPGVEDIAQTRALIDRATAEGLAGFHDRFDRIFDLKGKGYKGRTFDAQEIEAAQAALSNMIGGVGYFHGKTVIKGDDGTHVQSFSTSLLSAVPSRSFFPRGFLWDEGFHQLLLHKWDLGVTYDVVLHWLSHLHVSPSCPHALGWIPREIALGKQAQRRIPKEYLAQDVTVANPPTLLLLLEKVLDLSEERDKVCTDEEPPLHRKTQFIAAAQSRVERWMSWLLTSQRGQALGTFRWRGRDPNEPKLLSNTLASGLDDYPRATEPSEEEGHVDLLCWMIKACQVMSRMGKAVGDETKAKLYMQAAHEMMGVMDAVHWNESMGAYMDYGANSEDGVLVKAVPLRCIDRANRAMADVMVPMAVLNDRSFNPCPPNYEPLGLVSQEASLVYKRGSIVTGHVPRLGYVTLFPLLLGLLPHDSPKLGHTLDILADPEKLWSPYGLRSLSKSDKFYHMENGPGDEPYWRGYIWININYLALRALHQLQGTTGPYQERARGLYTALRENVLDTILSQYKATGYLWEQYHDETGQGLRSHPFTGWTALVVNVMAEQY